MAAYGIMRIEKRGRSAIYGLQIEANRTPQDHQQGRDFDNSDIDWTKTKDNIHIIHTVNWNKEITRRIKELGLKERKDSVVLLDALYTASPEWFETHTRKQMLEYFRDCLHFHVREGRRGRKNLPLLSLFSPREKKEEEKRKRKKRKNENLLKKKKKFCYDRNKKGRPRVCLENWQAVDGLFSF